MKKIIIFIVIVQIGLIGILSAKIYNKKKVLGTASVNVIDKKSIVLSPNRELRYFYEPKENSDAPFIKPPYFPYPAKYTINSDSLNERFEYSPEKPDGVFRIITLGDSFTFGLYVDTPDNWTELLEDKLNSLSCTKVKKFEVINLGVFGYDKEYSVERFRRRGVKYDPDLVIWLDVYFQRLTEETGRFMENQKDNPKIRGNADAQGKKEYPFEPWKRALYEILQKTPEKEILTFQGAAIKKLDQYFNKDLVFIPVKNFFTQEELNFSKNIISQRPKGHFFDGLRDIYATDGYFADKHPNKKGHEMIAEDVFNYLRANNIISCN